MKLMNLTGKRFGNLVVIKRGEDYVSGSSIRVQWLCKCDCGRIILTAARNLRRDKKMCDKCFSYDRKLYPPALEKCEGCEYLGKFDKCKECEK